MSPSNDAASQVYRTSCVIETYDGPCLHLLFRRQVFTKTIQTEKTNLLEWFGPERNAISFSLARRLPMYTGITAV